MDEIFFRELVIFLAVCLVFIGAIPLMIRGHYAKRIEATEEVAVAGAGGEDAAQAKPRLSKKRRARARQAKRAQKGD